MATHSLSARYPPPINPRALHPPPFNLSLTSLNDEGLGPNLPRGRGKSIGGDLDVSEEGSEQMIITLQSLHHGSIRYQHVRTGVGLAKKAKFL
jgi:hypothetical protein